MEALNEEMEELNEEKDEIEYLIYELKYLYSYIKEKKCLKGYGYEEEIESTISLMRDDLDKVRDDLDKVEEELSKLSSRELDEMNYSFELSRL